MHRSGAAVTRREWLKLSASTALIGSARANENPIAVNGGSRYSLPSGIAMRYSAASLTGLGEGAAVATCPDISGNGWTLTQAASGARPILTFLTGSGKPAIAFLGETQAQFLSNVSAMFDCYSHSVFYIVESLFMPYGLLMLIGSLGTGQLGFGVINEGGVVGTYDGTSGPLTATALGMARNGVSLAGYASSATGVTVYDNLGSQSMGLTYNETLTGITIGSWFPTAASGYGFMGNLHECIVYGRVLTLSEVNRIRAYARENYGVPVVKPPCNVVCIGDSIVAGEKSQTLHGWPRRLANVAPIRERCSIRNNGYGGRTAATLAATHSIQVAAFDSSYAKNIAVVAIGINDITDNATPAATVWGYIQTLCTALRGAGFQVLLSTITSDGNGFSAPLNALIRAGWSSFADAPMDPGSDANFGDNQPNSGPYYGGGVHLSDLGYQRYADLYAAPALVKMIG
jgi:lysophospholipase L1-like esterase